MGSAGDNKLKAWFKHGKKDYYLGGHPWWEVFRAVYQMKSYPYILSGMFLFSGYAWGFLRRMERPVPKELIRFHRYLQMQRIKKIFSNALGAGERRPQS